MIKKNIFNLKNNKKKNIFFLLLLIIILFIIIFLNFFNKNTFFNIPQFQDSFYIIPINKGGKEISNQDKKGLHLSNNNQILKKIENDPKLEFSIQLFSNENFKIVKDKRNEYLKIHDSFFISNDLHIVIFDSSLGYEYLLVYKNFQSRDSAMSYCNEFPLFFEKCIIVNVQNLY